VSKNLIELRNLLEREFEEIAAKNGDASTPDVIAAIRSKSPSAIRRCSNELENMGLGKLVDSVSRRIRNPFRSYPQPDLFAGFHGIPKAIAVLAKKKSRSRYTRKLLPQATLAELRDWLSEERRTTKAKLQRFGGVTALLMELTRYAAEDTTVENALAARAAALKAA
jgi:hypothetical protein